MAKMGAVDRADHLCTSYNLAQYSVKWWEKTVFFWLMELASTNSFILFRLCQQMKNEQPLHTYSTGNSSSQHLLEASATSNADEIDQALGTMLKGSTDSHTSLNSWTRANLRTVQCVVIVKFMASTRKLCIIVKRALVTLDYIQQLVLKSITRLLTVRRSD